MAIRATAISVTLALGLVSPAAPAFAQTADQVGPPLRLNQFMKNAKPAKPARKRAAASADRAEKAEARSLSAEAAEAFAESTETDGTGNNADAGPGDLRLHTDTADARVTTVPVRPLPAPLTDHVNPATDMPRDPPYIVAADEYNEIDRAADATPTAAKTIVLNPGEPVYAAVPTESDQQPWIIILGTALAGALVAGFTTHAVTERRARRLHLERQPGFRSESNQGHVPGASV